MPLTQYQYRLYGAGGFAFRGSRGDLDDVGAGWDGNPAVVLRVPDHLVEPAGRRSAGAEAADDLAGGVSHFRRDIRARRQLITDIHPAARRGARLPCQDVQDAQSIPAPILHFDSELSRGSI